MRKPFSYANITATLALFFAMSGGALAAKHYLISSTHQISPKVMKKLKGNAGKQGATGSHGLQGVTGLRGEKGEQGAPGTKGERGERGERGEQGAYPTVLPSGETESGDWGGGFTAGGEASYRETASFPI